MDYTELWKIALGVSGLGGVGAFVLWSLYKEWLKLPIFTTLTKNQTYRLMQMFMVFAFAFAVIALGVYSYIQTVLIPTDPSNGNEIHQTIIGDDGSSIGVNTGVINIGDKENKSKDDQQ